MISPDRHLMLAPYVERYLRRRQRAAIRLAEERARRGSSWRDYQTRQGRFLGDAPGQPLGRGYPAGATFRTDGESHSDAWRRLLRLDSCAYCGGPGGTVDHVVPRASGLRSVESWVNLVGACSACNSSKRDDSLLLFLLKRRASEPRRSRAA